MNVSIKAESQKFIEQQVDSGRFASAAAVLEAGIERLMLDALDPKDLAAINESRQQIARGEDLDWNDVATRLRTKYLGK